LTTAHYTYIGNIPKCVADFVGQLYFGVRIIHEETHPLIGLFVKLCLAVALIMSRADDLKKQSIRLALLIFITPTFIYLNQRNVYGCL